MTVRWVNAVRHDKRRLKDRQRFRRPAGRPTCRRARIPCSGVTDTDFLVRTRTFYDTVAADYDAMFSDPLAANPYYGPTLGVFAELVRAHIAGDEDAAHADAGNDGTAARSGRVADIGCGPGRVTAHLHSLGLDVFGIDLSPAMVELAGRLYPHLSFVQGSMMRLDLPDGSLSGVSSWYSTVHLPHEAVPAAYAEFHRVLEPGGYLVLAFQAGDNVRHLDEAFGHRVDIDFVRRSPDRATQWLREAGFEPRSQLVCEPIPGRELARQAFLIARRPLAADDAPDAADASAR